MYGGETVEKAGWTAHIKNKAKMIYCFSQTENTLKSDQTFQKQKNRTAVRFLRFLSFARGQYLCTAIPRKIQNPPRLFGSLSACQAVYLFPLRFFDTLTAVQVYGDFIIIYFLRRITAGKISGCSSPAAVIWSISRYFSSSRTWRYAGLLIRLFFSHGSFSRSYR